MDIAMGTDKWAMGGRAAYTWQPLGLWLGVVSSGVF
jgi:heme exporter protein D